MKNPPSIRTYKFLRLLLPVIAVLAIFTRDARAGLTFTLDIYRNSQGQFFNFYTPMSTNTTTPAAPVGMYIISSPQWPVSGSTRQYEITSSGLNPNPISGQETGYSDYASTMNQITNGTWTILFTNATTTNLFTFKVTAPNMNSNLMPATVITYPANSAVNVTNQPTFTWQRPVNFGFNGNPYVANNDFSFYQSASIPTTQTYWTIPTPIPNTMNCSFRVSYITNYATPLFVATTPLSTNVSHTPISGWISASTVETGDSVSFTVTTPSSSGHTLIAHYAFDNTGNEGLDSSGNGNDIQCGSGWGPGETFSTDAIAGGEALQFFGGSSITPCNQAFNVWTNTLAGSFTVSAWIKTTTVVGNDGDALNDYTGQSVIYADNNNLGATPIAMTGSKVAFRTTDPDGHDDTLHSTQSVTTGNYVHIVSTRNQATGEKKIYINGTLDSSDIASTESLSGAQYVSIGGELSSAYIGLVDDVQIYSGVLSASEVAALYATPGTTVTNVAGADFATALNTTNLTWNTSGDSSWFVQTTNTYDGVSAAQSGSVVNNQSSTLSATVTGPGTLTFYWSSIANDLNQGFDCEFAMDNNDMDDLYGNNSWYQDGPFTIPAGQHTLTWTTYAYGDTDPTEAAFLDKVSFTAAASNPNTAPIITINPFNQTNYPGYNVALLAAATSNPTATWQWFKVSSGAISGATNALYIPSTSGTAGVAGSYYAIASNLAGSANTLTANVTFANAPLPPNWSVALKSPFTAVDSSTLTKDYYLGCAADSAGNIYAAAQYIGNMNVITNGNVAGTLTAAGVYGGAALVKHAANGSPLWAVGLTNNSSSSYSYGIAVAAAPGNGAYLASGITGTNWLGTNKFSDIAGSSIVFSRFDASGSNVWSKFIGNTNQVFTSYNMVVSDAAGNVTLAGTMSGTVSFGGTNLTAASQTGFLIQYATNGAVRWAQVLPDNVWNLAYGNGQLYLSLQSAIVSGVTNVTIGSFSNLTDRAWAVAALNTTNGQALWLRSLGNQYGANFSGLLDDMPLVSASGTNVFIMGNAFGTSNVFGNLSVSLPNGRGQYFARYDSAGNPKTAIAFGSPTSMIWASAANASGVYVCGDFDNYSQFGSDIIAAPVYAQNDLGPLYFSQPFIAKFDSNGNPLWARNGVSSDLANFRGIATTADGVWAAGFLKITNSVPAQFNTNAVYSDLQIIPGSPFSTTIWNQGGLLAKITESSTIGTPVTLLYPQASGTNFQFSFLSQSGFNHSILYRTNLATGTWLTNSTVVGDGTLKTNSLPLSLFNPSKQGFIRVTTQ